MTRITNLFGIQYPIIQAGMIWCSGSKLAAAVSNAGGLGIIGAGSMKPDVLDLHLKKIKTLTDKPYAVNFPIFSNYSDEQVDLILKHGVRHVFTSAGSPKKYTAMLKSHGLTVTHVVPSPLFAQKCVDAGVDAIVAEGFEAGGHNGLDEITTMVLVPQVVDAVSVPVIAAGGIGDGRTMAAAMALGADAVQIGSRFAVTKESSAHENFKQRIVQASAGETRLLMKKLMPVRLMHNAFSESVMAMEANGASKEELAEFLGKGRAKKAIFDGDLNDGEIEIGQISGLIKDIPSAETLVKRLIAEYNAAIQTLKAL
jgi:enoyl-[acyl-carrier protein] reductase II